MNSADKMSAVMYWQSEWSHTHPLTCGNDSTHRKLIANAVDENDIILVCPDCDYVQENIPEIVYERYDKRQRYTHVVGDNGEVLEEHYVGVNDCILGKCKWNFWDYLTLPFWRLKGKLENAYYATKYWFQRRKKGYSEDEVWGLSDAILHYVYPRFKAFIKMEKHGYPSGIAPDGKEFTPEKWDEVLKKIERAFDLWKLDDDCKLKWDTIEELHGYYEEMEEGFILFGKYMGTLWD